MINLIVEVLRLDIVGKPDSKEVDFPLKFFHCL